MIRDGVLIFSCLRGDDAASLFITSDYAETRSIQIGNICADFYQANEESSSNMLVWTSEEDDLAFCIMANLPDDTMIKLVEGVQKNNFKKFEYNCPNDLLHSFTGMNE